MDKNVLHKDEQIALLEQMLEGDEAIEELASIELVEMPGYLAEEVFDSIVSAEAKTMNGYKWFQLFCYSAKVAFATACAIVVLFDMPDMRELQTHREPVRYERTSYVADVFDFISEKIFDGGLKNEK